LRFLLNYFHTYILSAAPHGPSLSADVVGCHFNIILLANDDGLCGAGADMPLTLSARVLEVPTPLTFQVIKPRYTSWLMSVVSPYRSTSPAAKMTTDIAGRRYWSMWRGSYLHQLLIVLTLFATPGWQR